MFIGAISVIYASIENIHVYENQEIDNDKRKLQNNTTYTLTSDTSYMLLRNLNLPNSPWVVFCISLAKDDWAGSDKSLVEGGMLSQI